MIETFSDYDCSYLFGVFAQGVHKLLQLFAGQNFAHSGEHLTHDLRPVAGQTQVGRQLGLFWDH